MRDGLHLMAEREGKLNELQTMLDAAIAEGGSIIDEELQADIEAATKELTQQGF